MNNFLEIKKKLTAIFFYLTIIYIGVGSTGAGIQNNMDISYGFLYLFILMFFFFYKDLISNINFETLMPIGIMLVSFFISCFFAEFHNKYEIWFRYYGILACIFFSYISYILLINKIISFKKVLVLIAALGVFHTLVLLNIWISEDNPAEYNWVNGIPFFSNIRHLADYLSICFFCSFFLFLTGKEKRMRILWFVGSVIILTCIFWSGSRAAYIGIFPAVLLLLLLLKRNIINFFTTIFIFFISAFLTIFFQTSQFNVGFLGAFTRSAGTSLNQISSNRIDLYKTVFEWFSYHPIWGLGAESVKELGIYQGGDMLMSQAHNSLLQILIEFGFIGGGAVFIVIYKFIIKFKDEKCNDIYAISLAVILNIFIASLFNGGFYYVITISALCLFVAIAFAYKKLNYEN